MSNYTLPLRATFSAANGTARSGLDVQGKKCSSSSARPHLSQRRMVCQRVRAVRMRRGTRMVASAEGKEVELDLELDTDDGTPAMDPRRAEEKFAVIDTGLWECSSCQFVYDQKIGDSSYPVSAGTRFQDLPADWRCPVCGSESKQFVSKSKVIAGFEQNQGYGLGGNTLTSGQKQSLIYGALFLFFALFISGYLLD